MPKTAIDYSNACIYKLVCNDINIHECYVGSTTNFSQRKRDHKSICNNEKSKNHNLYVYKFIRDHGGWDNWSMIEIEKYECNDGNELRARERYYIEFLKAELNKIIPSRTTEEYYQDNKDKIDEYRKQYQHEHKQEKKEYDKQYRIEHKQEKKEYAKQYQLEHKEELKEYRKQWYQDNKNEILEKQKQKHTCECGGRYTTYHKSQHLKSKKHQAFISTSLPSSSS